MEESILTEGVEEPACRFRRLRDLEAELVALVAEVFRLAMHDVAVRAFKFVAVVRGRMRVGGLDVLRLFNQSLDVVALLARVHRGFLGIGLVGAVAGFTGEAHAEVAVGAELLIGSLSGAEGKRRSAERCGEERRHLHYLVFLLFLI